MLHFQSIRYKYASNKIWQLNHMFKLVKFSQFASRQLTRSLFASFAFPKHEVLTMPALSPTMTEGKILKWHKKAGDLVQPGDVICEVETDKATMGFQVQEKGYLAKILDSTQTVPLGTPVAVVTKKSADVAEFASYKFGASAAEAESKPQETKVQPVSTPVPASQPSTPAPVVAPPTTTPPTQKISPQQTETSPQLKNSGERVFASPLAKTVANEKGIDISQLKGSGPNGRIIKQDVEGYVPPTPAVVSINKEELPSENTDKKDKVQKPAKGFIVPQNPFEEIALSSMRKTVARRLTESKQTVPHYYVTSSIEMGATNELRNNLNKREKENGVKISINDIIVKAMALALRDYPDVNVQWNGTSIKKFKHADISVAVAMDGGLITPIVFRAETLGLLDIARRTKDIAKRAKEGKLDPSEFVGGTTTISNLGMFGVNSVSSIINPPQASILGVGKTEKKLVFAEGPTPYRVAEIMDVIASVDHRAVDGALTAQWLNRIKHYLENPTHMIL